MNWFNCIWFLSKVSFFHSSTFRTHFPWSLDEQCNFYSTQFGQNLPVVGLVSYPSSGNTWLRYLIEGAIGYYTGSMYNDIAIAHKGKKHFFKCFLFIAYKSTSFLLSNLVYKKWVDLQAINEVTLQKNYKVLKAFRGRMTAGNVVSPGKLKICLYCLHHECFVSINVSPAKKPLINFLLFSVFKDTTEKVFLTIPVWLWQSKAMVLPPEISASRPWLRRPPRPAGGCTIISKSLIRQPLCW